MEVNTTLVMQAIQQNQQVRSRVYAIVMNSRWDENSEKDPREPFDLEAVMWAVATNNTVTDAVKAEMEAQDENNNVDRAIIATITDSDLEYIVLSVALPRLEAADKKQQDAIDAATRAAEEENARVLAESEEAAK